MRREEKALHVLTRAMEWYKLNLKQGCVRDNFIGQARRLWNACAAYEKSLKRRDKGPRHDA